MVVHADTIHFNEINETQPFQISKSIYAGAGANRYAAFQFKVGPSDHECLVTVTEAHPDSGEFEVVAQKGATWGKMRSYKPDVSIKVDR
jgi:hypothetical protein